MRGAGCGRRRPRVYPDPVPQEKPRVVLWSHLPPAGGGLTVVARRLASDPDLNEHFDMRFRGTAEAAPEKVGRFHLGNVRRAVRDAVVLFREARGAAVVELFSSGHTTTVLLRAIVLGLAARLAGARLLVYLGSGRLYPADPTDFVPTRGMRPTYRLLGGLVHAFVLIDPSGGPVVAPMVGRSRLVVIPGPVDPERFDCPARPDRDRPVVVHCGRITAEKGIPDLLDALALLDRRGVTDWEVRLVGPLERSTGGELAAITAAADELGRVTFVGFLDDVAPELARADVFVSASHREGVSGAIVEACMSGLPVVATRVGATASIVRDGTDGLLVEPRDPAALADALGKVLADGSLRLEMGRRGREHAVDHYGRPHVAARYLELFGELV